MSRPARCRISLTSVALLLLCTVSLADDGVGLRPMGAGSFPISPMHAATWFAAKADQDRKVLTLVVFFEGEPGWQDAARDFNWVVNASPATIDMNVGLTPVHVKYWPETMTVQILGHDFTLATDNAFLLSGIDGTVPQVRGLGVHDLAFPSDDNPALALLKRDPVILAALLGQTSPARPGRASPEPPDSPAAVDRQGLDLLAKNAPEEDRKACELFRTAAARGYAPSQYHLGICYGEGRGVGVDLAVANEWYLKAARQGHTDARYKLAHSYRVGRGIAIDLAAALEWYTRAADDGDVDAQQNLGTMYSLGQGAPTNPAKAFEWLLKAAENGAPAAQYEVARRLRHGEGIQKDLPKAYAWLLVLASHRATIDSESWKQVEELLTSVKTKIDDPTKVAAHAIAQRTIRTQTRQYLESLAK